jgi:hypothetical protein
MPRASSGVKHLKANSISAWSSGSGASASSPSTVLASRARTRSTANSAETMMWVVRFMVLAMASRIPSDLTFSR